MSFALFLAFNKTLLLALFAIASDTEEESQSNMKRDVKEIIVPHKTIRLPRMFYYSTFSRIPSPTVAFFTSETLLVSVHFYDYFKYQSDESRFEDNCFNLNLIKKSFAQTPIYKC